MNVTITPAKLHGDITPPPSKSQAHRLIIAAALAQGESTISNVALSQDIQATIRCMEALGASFSLNGDTLTVRGITPGQSFPTLPRLDCGESGSTLRFLIPVALVVAGGGVFIGQGRLMQRPQKPYFDIFDQKGISYTQEGDTLTVSGTLTSGEYALPGDVSSQFFSGLMFALPMVEGNSKIRLTSPLESGSYVEMTHQALKVAGIDLGTGTIPGGQHYSPFTQAVEADWSQAGFFYAAHGLGSEVSIRGLSPFSLQGDTKIVPYYMQLCSEEEEVLLDVQDCPDLVPPLAVLAAGRAGKPTVIGNAARLRLKESDRLAAVTEVLTQLGVPVEEYPDGLSIVGVDTFHGNVTIDCHKDHRIAMMAAMAATRCDGPVTLVGAECVAKSYPNFWEDYVALGGQIVKSEG